MNEMPRQPRWSYTFQVQTETGPHLVLVNSYWNEMVCEIPKHQNDALSMLVALHSSLQEICAMGMEGETPFSFGYKALKVGHLQAQVLLKVENFDYLLELQITSHSKFNSYQLKVHLDPINIDVVMRTKVDLVVCKYLVIMLARLIEQAKNHIDGGED